jgi:hypothetical protein
MYHQTFAGAPVRFRIRQEFSFNHRIARISQGFCWGWCGSVALDTNQVITEFGLEFGAKILHFEIVTPECLGENHHRRPDHHFRCVGHRHRYDVTPYRRTPDSRMHQIYPSVSSTRYLSRPFRGYVCGSNQGTAS